MTNEEALQIISWNLSVAIHDAGKINPEYEYEQVKALDMAYDAIEKQIPKRPNLEGDGYADGALVYDTWVCPDCGKRYEIYYETYNYCPNCGQAIEWEKEEDD